MGLSVKRSRFTWSGYTYPLHFVVFEDPKKLGYFNCFNYQIGIHKKLMYIAKEGVLKDVLRHELAHLYSYLTYGKKYNNLDNHGVEFKTICRNFNWSQNVYLAYSNIDEENLEFPSNEKFEKLKKRIEKLMALSQSDNPHEAEAATIKANEYLLKNNINNLSSDDVLEVEETVVLSVLEEKRLNSKINAVYDILQYFYVQPVINRNSKGISLDIVGSKINVEIANYIAKYLCNEFERLWSITKKKDPNISGLRQKNSYIYGLAQGFCSKLRKEREQVISPLYGKELIVLEQQLENRVKTAFPRLSRQARSHATLDRNALNKGHIDGLGLQIKKGISKGNKGHLLDFVNS